MIAVLKIIFLLGFLILIHEAGHYTVAKICKIRVNEFAVGFGPKLFSKQKGETLYELRLVPLGGFVKLEGEEEHSDKEGSFNKASIPKRIAVILAGATVNIIFGILAYLVLIVVRHMMKYNNGIIDALGYGIQACGELITELGRGILELFTGKISLDNMTGPVGISSMVAKTNGITEFVYLLSIVSISLGVTNLLPFPPLDGGKGVLLILEAIRRKPLKEETELKIQSIGFIILIGLSVIVTIKDIAQMGTPTI